jgi:hypothetical protein
MLSGLALLPLSCPQNYYDLSLALSPPSRPKLLRPRKNKCRVVWPSHHRDAQNNYDLEKINVECVKWSGPLTTVTPKINTTLKNKC